ncbi:hypothetical protein ACE1TI_08640 [Alteribacillus sp. JSM 102045]
MNKEELVKLMQRFIERAEQDQQLTVETAVQHLSQEMEMYRKESV